MAGNLRIREYMRREKGKRIDKASLIGNVPMGRGALQCTLHLCSFADTDVDRLVGPHLPALQECRVSMDKWSAKLPSGLRYS